MPLEKNAPVGDDDDPETLLENDKSKDLKLTGSQIFGQDAETAPKNNDEQRESLK